MSRCIEEDILILSTSYFPDKTEAHAMRMRIADRHVQLSRDPNTKPIKVSRKCQLNAMRAILVAEGLLAPVRRLPAEILGEIFAHTMPSFSVQMALDPRIAGWPPAFFNDHEPYPAHVRSVICRVCRRWANVALDTPRLWTTLTIDYKLTLPDLQQALVYSRACPLEIYIARLPDSLKHRFSIILDLLRSEIHRTRQLVFADYEGPCNFWGLFPADECTKAPMLEDIAWHWQADPEGSAAAVPEPKIGQIHAPNLKSISCVGSPFTYKSFTAGSLRHLQRFCFEAMRTPFTWRDHVDFLLQCPSLVELEICHISQWDVEESDRYDGTRVKLPHLKSLAILDSQTASASIFLKLLRAPNLQNLSLRLDARSIRAKKEHPSIDQALRLLLAETPTSLRSISLCHLVVRGDGNLPLLSSFSNLSSLSVTKCVVHDEALAELIPPKGSTPTAWPCPCLSQLTFVNAKLSGDILVRLVRSRTYPDRILSSCSAVMVDECPGLEEHHVNELTQLARSRSRMLHFVPYLT